VIAAAALALAGCGARAPLPAGLRLERADLVLFGRALQRLQRPVDGEVAAARAVWPTLNRGLPASVPAALAQGIAAAEARSGQLVLPTRLIEEGGLTGPAASVGGLLKSYALLTRRGWQFLARASAAGVTAAGTAANTSAATDARKRREPTTAAAFLRANAPLYVYCIYDGHFDLSLLGAKLQQAYQKLGGRAAFGAALTPGEVAALAAAYSIPAVRLAPHPPPGLKL
jgi:hypothetical protein